jgi:hypothetical protein
VPQSNTRSRNRDTGAPDWPHSTVC